MSLYEVMSERREEVLAFANDLIRRERPASAAVDSVRNASLPGFLDAVTREMRFRGGGGRPDRAPLSNAEGPIPKSESSDIDELVHMYGSLCFSTMEIAERNGVLISLREHQALNQALDACIARTVVQWERDKSHQGEEDQAADLGFVATELRKAVHSASTSFHAIRTGRIGVQGVTGDVVERSHSRIRTMVQRLHTQLYLGPTPRERLGAARLVEQSVDSVLATALDKNVRLEVESDPSLEVQGDADLLGAALTKLLQNAVQFTPRDGKVAVRSARTTKGRVSIEIEDQCGGLPPGTAERLSAPLLQVSDDATGLAFARQVIEDHRGTVRVRDLRGRGCIFVVELPAARTSRKPD